ncbi:phytoene desaturase family protein [Halotalea alkalilenta]|uniref:phytoene desaturase family protein n=1 Tax=Halotalea alkalilenta TaxID=376489 RepID=UPI00048A244A|nr:phytoene desaturase family protein [Halotalea alkalilenta]
MSRALVIGAGFGGMAAALRARAKGYEVTLIERCERLGGRAQVFEHEGYRFDAGPTVITAPFLIEELFSLFGERLEDSLEMIALDTWYAFRFSDGDRFAYGNDLSRTEAQIARISPPDVEGYHRLMETSREIFELGFEQLAARPFDRFATMAAQVPALLKLRSYKSVWGLVADHIQHEKLREAFTISPLLVGGHPFRTTSIYALILYLERKWGVHFPRGGTGALVDALASLITRQGITVRTGTTVRRILVRHGSAIGVELEDGERLEADEVISDVDPTYLYTQMLDAVAPSARLKLRVADYSMGLFVLYFGTNRQWPEIDHHTISLGPRYRGLLDDIFIHRRLTPDFSLYLHRPTATDASFAPAGHDAFYVLVPVPNLLGNVDWHAEKERFAERIIATLDATLLPGLRESLTVQFSMTPLDFEQRYLSRHGSGFSIAPRFRQSAWFRFHNRAEGLAHLYLVGAGTHPGAGVPGVLSSAKLVGELLPEAS